MKILLLGAPASGKGTVAERLSQRLNIPFFSIGQLLREIPENNPNKKLVDDCMEKGELVPKEIAAELVKQAVEKPSAKRGFVMDGWGRRMDNLEYFDPNFDYAVYLRISPETAFKRISSRRICEKCGAVYNLISSPPKVDGVCDVCSGKLIKRDDETMEATERRIEIFTNETAQTIEYFKKNNKLIEINGEGSINEVFDLVVKALGV